MSASSDDFQKAMQIGRVIPAVCVIAWVVAGAEAAYAAIVNGDPLELAIAPPDDALNIADNSFRLFAAEALTLDDNIYRLSSDVTDLQSLNGIGADASRNDRINTTSVGLDGVWNRGRQTFTVDLRADDNRFDLNKNLDNVSTADKAIWRWDVGGVLYGQVGALYNSSLVSFINAPSYARDLYAVTTYVGAGRYQLGPRWAIFGGVLESGTTLSEASLQSNDLHAKSVDFGTEYATGPKDSMGVEYRYTDARYPQGIVLNSDYREDTGRLVVRHAFSEKTNVEANAGFLKREYASEDIRPFSGDVWGISANWQATEKVQVGAQGWRNLQAYVTAQSDYYASKGESISPQWTASEKIAVVMTVAYEVQDYIGVREAEVAQGARRDTLATSQLGLTYTPLQYLIFDFSYAYERRDSNESRFQYNDNVISAKVTVKH